MDIRENLINSAFEDLKSGEFKSEIVITKVYIFLDQSGRYISSLKCILLPVSTCKISAKKEFAWMKLQERSRQPNLMSKSEVRRYFLRICTFSASKQCAESDRMNIQSRGYQVLYKLYGVQKIWSGSSSLSDIQVSMIFHNISPQYFFESGRFWTLPAALEGNSATLLIRILRAPAN
jgi:hypothetical protein